MNFDPLSAAFDLGKTAIERIWPDPIRRAEEMRKLEELRAKGNSEDLNAHVQLMLAQIKVNEISAAHPSIWVAGPRPFILWVGGFSLGYAGLIYPLLLWVWSILQGVGTIPADMHPPPFVESATLSAIVGALLGVGGMRSYDKKQGTQTDRIGS